MRGCIWCVAMFQSKLEQVFSLKGEHDPLENDRQTSSVVRDVQRRCWSVFKFRMVHSAL